MSSCAAFGYIVVSVFCVLTALIILTKISYSIGTEHENRHFRGMVLCFLAYALLELVWVLGDSHMIPMSRSDASILKAIDTMLIPAMVFLWFWYAEIKFRSKFVGNWVARWVSIVPITFLVVCYIVSIFNGVVFSIGPEGELVFGPLGYLTGIVDNTYGIAIIAHAVIRLVREKAPYRRKDYITQIVCIVACTVGGIADAAASRMLAEAVTSTPIMPLAIALAFIYLIPSLQEERIYSDALTGLNNRRRADEYIANHLAMKSDAVPFYLFLLDVDRFKEINDTLGHLEGDRALRAVAKGIAHATDEFRGFVARWGGDEFIVAISGHDPALPELLTQRVRECIRSVAETEAISYLLDVSVGFAKCTPGHSKMHELISAADKMLYEQKSLVKPSA